MMYNLIYFKNMYKIVNGMYNNNSRNINGKRLIVIFIDVRIDRSIQPTLF